MGWYQRRVHGEGAQFRNGNHPPSRQTRGGGSHPLSLEAEGSLPAARASAPSADRAHTTHYQQRPPLSLGGDAAGCVCVCVRVDDRFHCRTSWLFCRGSASCDHQQPRTPAFWEIFPEKSFYPGFESAHRASKLPHEPSEIIYGNASRLASW